MVYQGHVENGMIRLQDPVVLPEGATVNVEVVPPLPAGERQEPGLSLYDRLKPLVGAAKNLPSLGRIRQRRSLSLRATEGVK
jgi:hypothetical protein